MMEFHYSHIRAKRVWNYLRAIYFMMRKGVISKRKLLMDLNLAMKKRNKLVSRSLHNLFLFHHTPHGKGYKYNNFNSPVTLTAKKLGFALRGEYEYEFSCSNSPNPAVFSHRRRHNYFPCLRTVSEEPDTWQTSVVLKRIEYSPSPSPSPQLSLFPSGELAPGERQSPLRSCVRICNYSDEDEDDDDELEKEFQEEEGEVDDEAEEFIRRFYEQLRAQNRIALLQYQEKEYQDMLARGT